jgi:hypothetical protein
MAEAPQTPDAPAPDAPGDTLPPAGSSEFGSESSGVSARPDLPQLDMRGSFNGLLRSIVINAIVPLIIYNLLKSRGASDLVALGVAAVAPALDGLVSVLRQRRLDLLSGLVLAGIVISMIAVLLGGDTRVLLIRESILTGALGVACFVSLLFPRPLMFYFGRYFASGNDPVKAQGYDRMWQFPYFRYVNRVITVVWGVAFTGEFALRAVMAFTLPISVVLAVAPVALGSITVLTILWTLAYSRRARRRGEEMRRQASASTPPVA